MMSKHISLSEGLDRLAILLYGMKRTEAMEQGICLKCKQPPILELPQHRFEYEHSGLCDQCFDEEVEEAML